MKKLKVLLACILFTTLSHAQSTWAPAGATWLYRCINNAVPKYDAWLEIKFTNTVQSNGKTCRALDGRFYGTMGPGIPVYQQNYVYCLTYENNNVIFIQTGPTRFDTIANFNALPGQGWYSFGYDTTCKQFGQPRVKHTVYDTGHVTINGQYLKRLNMSPPSSSNPLYIVEKIGPLQGFLYTYYYCYLDGWARYGNFSCYKDDNFPLYSPYPSADCNFLSTTEYSLNNTQHLRLFPNPVSSVITLETNSECSLQLYNNTGALVYSNNQLGSGQNQLDLSTLPSGLYHAITISKQGSQHHKLIKE